MLWSQVVSGTKFQDFRRCPQPVSREVLTPLEGFRCREIQTDDPGRRVDIEFPSLYVVVIYKPLWPRVFAVIKVKILFRKISYFPMVLMKVASLC